MISLCQAQGSKELKSSSDIILPPLEQRIIIGTWRKDDFCTRSFETYRGTTYAVIRCIDGSGGKDGQALNRVSSNKFSSQSSSFGDYYVILENGNLSIRDRKGEIGVELKHADLWPKKKTVKETQSEDSKSIKLNCYEVGYRYGYVGTNAANRKKTNPDWDFPVPNRCRNDAQTSEGIQAGTRAAW